MILPCTTESLLKRTTSRCPVCHASVPAEVWKVDEGGRSRVFLRRRCAEHGFAEACIASDARFYWLAKGDPKNACCGGSACSASDGVVRGTLGRNAAPPKIRMNSEGHEEHNGDAGSVERPASQSSSPFAPLVPVAVQESDTMERLSTCLALIEIVNSCNLACPTCYADSPQSRAVDAVPLDELKARIQGVIDRKGRIEILQLSGGEPTLHPQFFELLGWLIEHRDIDYVLLNTNGVRIASDDAFLDSLAMTFRPGKFQLYLQFDGVQEAAQRALRGGDFREVRRRAIERCGAHGIPITLAMTITPENLPHVWEAVKFGLQFPHVRGVSFQPMFTSGRVPTKFSADFADGADSKALHLRKSAQSAGQNARSDQSPGSSRHSTPLNTADVILALVEQSDSCLRFEDFTPLPCGDPNCATIGYLLRFGGATRSISEFVDFTKVQDFLRDKVRYSPDDLARCGCESEPLGELLHALEKDEGRRMKDEVEPEGAEGRRKLHPSSFDLPPSIAFRLFIKPFMDAWSWDEDRIDRCCTHVIRPDGKLDSFCRYYALKNGR